MYGFTFCDLSRECERHQLSDKSLRSKRTPKMPHIDVQHLIRAVLFSTRSRHGAVQETSCGVNEERSHASGITTDAVAN